MSIITFWNNEREETGKTLAIAAIATYMAIEHNYKILIVSTGYKKHRLVNCFFEDKKIIKNMGIFGPNTNVAMEDGIEGLAKIMKSNKISPDSITNYTKVVYSDRLEILPSFNGSNYEYEELRNMYPDIINLANSYYDLVFVDLDSELQEKTSDAILNNSNLIIATLSQRLSSINSFLEYREKNKMFKDRKTLILIGRYDKYSKYTIKNISRYMKEKNRVSTIPYNTLFFEASEEAKVPDLFWRLRKVDEDDRNAIFINEVKRAVENIIYRLKDLQTRM